MRQKPYIIKEIVHLEYVYNPEYGNDRICECGHTYVRHFDSYQDMAAVGCKYCECDEFIEVLPGQKTCIDAEGDGFNDGVDGLPRRTEYEGTKWKEIYDRWYEYGNNKRNAKDYKF